MATQPTIDRAKRRAFLDKVIGDTSGMAATLLATIGDRLGLFKDLAANGPATSAEMAARTGIDERYAREWLGGLASAGYLEYDPASGRFTLPPEYETILVQETSPQFFGGLHQMMTGQLSVLDRLLQAFRQGGGVPQSAYDPSLWEGMERASLGRFESMLVQQWLPAMPDVVALLERGCDVADIGCGAGHALIKLARTYPQSRYVGYDVFEPSVARATANAEAAGVADRVGFQQLDASTGLPTQYDVITTFDVVHDAVDPGGLLRAIRQALRPVGRYVCVEVNCSAKLEENVGPISTLFHAFSVFYCLTTSLANQGAGLGALGLPEPKMQEMCAAAGFSSVRLLPLQNPFNNVYEARP